MLGWSQPLWSGQPSFLAEPPDGLNLRFEKHHVPVTMQGDTQIDPTRRSDDDPAPERIRHWLLARHLLHGRRLLMRPLGCERDGVLALLVEGRATRRSTAPRRAETHEDGHQQAVHPRA